MIDNPKHGWCNFQLGDFKGHPSYLTDVPLDLLDAFIDYHIKGTGTAWFDEEGADFTLVINPYSIFIIAERYETVLYEFPDVRIEELEKELINDIESDLNEWMYFIPTDEWEEIIEHRNTIRQKIAKLKKLIK